MSRRTRIQFAAAITLAVLAAADLVGPSTAFAQGVTAGQALLNQTAASPDLSALYKTVPSASFPSGADEVAGDRALLGRIEAPSALEWYFGSQSVADALIDGERALLGRWPVSQRQSMEDWAHRPSTPELGSRATKVKTLSSRRDIPSFTLGSRGAVKLAVRSDEARYGTIRTADDRGTLVVISLGATSAEGSLTLTMAADQLVPNGRYAVGRSIRALVVSGGPEHPTGAFHGETGWVTITAVENGRIAGEFELLARGFLATDPQDERRWVAVLGQFEARVDSTALATVGLKPGALK